MKKRLILALLVALPVLGKEAPSYWCTAHGITLSYAKEQVWGHDQISLAEAVADALANCRSILSQCQIEECYKRQGADSLPQRFE